MSITDYHPDEIKEWAEEYGTTVAVIKQCIRDGWDPDFEGLDLGEVNYDDYEPVCGLVHAHSDACYA